jgi:hypothetical protein
MSQAATLIAYSNKYLSGVESTTKYLGCTWGTVRAWMRIASANLEKEMRRSRIIRIVDGLD